MLTKSSEPPSNVVGDLQPPATLQLQGSEAATPPTNTPAARQETSLNAHPDGPDRHQATAVSLHVHRALETEVRQETSLL